MGLSEKRLYLIIIKSIKIIVLHPHSNGLKPTDSTLSWWKFIDASVNECLMVGCFHVFKS